MDQIDWLIQGPDLLRRRRLVPQGYFSFEPVVRNDQTLTHTVSGTHSFATTPTINHLVVCTHSFLNMSEIESLTHLVVIRGEFVCPNGDLANGRYRR